MWMVYSKREYFAKLRTALANDRTLLAYGRTSLASIGLGILLLHFVEKDYSLYFGFFSFVVGIGIGLVGLWEFYCYKKKLGDR